MEVEYYGRMLKSVIGLFLKEKKLIFGDRVGYDYDVCRKFYKKWEDFEILK